MTSSSNSQTVQRSQASDASRKTTVSGGNMALSPAEIKQTLEEAQHLQRRLRSTQAFILAWSAWEAYNYRFIVTAIQMQGLTQTAARSVLSDLNSHQVKNMQRIRTALLTQRPEQAKGVGPIWTQIESAKHLRSFRQRRNGLVHGSASADPRVLSRGVNLIQDAINSELLADMRGRIRSGDRAGTTERIGEILSSPRFQAGSRRGTGSITQVREWLRG